MINKDQAGHGRIHDFDAALLCPWRITAIVAAALVLTSMQRGRW